MAQIFRSSRKTIGARLSHDDAVMLASADIKQDTTPDADAYKGVDAGSEEDLATLTEEASQAPVVPVAKPAQDVPKEIVQGYPIPKPRPKPIEILMMAAANMTIEPASAPPPSQVIRTKPSVVADSIGAVQAAETMVEEPTADQTSNASAKGSFADALRDGTANGAPLIKPLMASMSGADINWWPEPLIFNPDKAVRRDGAPQQFTTSDMSLVPNAQAQTPMQSQSSQTEASGKGDMLVVERSGKGSLPSTLPDLVKGIKKVGQLETN